MLVTSVVASVIQYRRHYRASLSPLAKIRDLPYPTSPSLGWEVANLPTDAYAAWHTVWTPREHVVHAKPSAGARAPFGTIGHARRSANTTSAP